MTHDYAARDREIEMSYAAMRQGQAAQREIDGLHKALEAEVAQREACEERLAEACDRIEELERERDDAIALLRQYLTMYHQDPPATLESVEQWLQAVETLVEEHETE